MNGSEIKTEASVALTDIADATLDQLVEIFIERNRQGDSVDVEEFADANPEHADTLRAVLPAVSAMERFGKQSALENTSLERPTFDEGNSFGDYKIGSLLGRGGMGSVYEAFQNSLRRHVALKILPPESLPSERSRDRFMLEAHAAAKLSHPNIIPVYEVGCLNNCHFYSMQLVKGSPLSAVIEDLTRTGQSAKQSELVSHPDVDTISGHVTAPDTKGSSTAVSSPLQDVSPGSSDNRPNDTGASVH